MISPESAQSPPAADRRFSRAGFIAGLVAMLPMSVSQVAFGAVVGTLAAQKGLTLLEALAMSGLVFAGLSQVVVMQAWPGEFTWATLAALVVTTLTVNLRFFLMSLTFQPWLGRLPASRSYPALLIVTDPGWLQAMRYHAEGGRDAAFLYGGGIFVYVTWVLSTWLGYAFSSWLTDPRRFGIDLLIPAFFAALLIPAWRGKRRAVPWLVAGIVAVIVERLGFDYWFIVAGSAAGAVAAGMMRDE